MVLDKAMHETPTEKIWRIQSLIKDRERLAQERISARKLRRLVHENKAITLAKGQYISIHNWQRLSPQEQHLGRIIAHSRALKHPVFTHQSATILHGLPVLHIPHKVHVRGTSGSSSASFYRHEDQYTIQAPTTCFSRAITATDIASTVAGCARTLPCEDAVVIADGALSRRQGPHRLPHALLYAALTSLKHHGCAKARKVAQLMSDKTDSPGESLTRLHLHEYGLHPVEQYPVSTDAGEFVGDFGFIAQKIMVEFDGRIKQTSRVMNPDGWAVDREKERENALMRLGWRILRLNWEHVRRPESWVLREALQNFGLLD